MFIKNCNLRKSLGMNRMLNLDTGANGGGEAGAESNGESTETKEKEIKTFDDVLKDKSYQSEFDKRVSKALETAKGKWETDYQAKIEEAKTEAQKLAKMNADQKAEYESNKRVEELEKREKDITTRELKATAYETLAEKGLPKELVNILNYGSAESCNQSIEAVEKAFQSAVASKVNEKLRGGAPPSGNSNTQTSGFGFNFTGVRPKK